MARQVKVSIIGDAGSLQRAFRKASAESSLFERSVGGVGRSLLHVGKAAAFAAGAAGIGAVVATLKTGYDEWQQSAQVQALVEAHLKSTGGAANVTSQQIDQLSTALMNKSGVDDEAIKSGAAMLLTFTNVRNEAGKGNDIFNQSTSTLLDMSVALGVDAPKAAMQLGKALNDPVKGISALRRVGVSFTDSQKDMIEKLVKTGKTVDAQKLILRELNKEFGKSAEKVGSTLPGKLNVLKQNFSNLAGTLFGQVAPAFSTALSAASGFLTKFNNAKGFTAKMQVVWTTAEDAAKRLTDGLASVVSAINWTAVWGRARGIGDGLAAKFKAIDWSAVGSAIGDGFSSAVSLALQATSGLPSQLESVFHSIDWQKLGRAMGPGLATALVTAFMALTDPGFWARNWDLALAVALTAFGGPIGKLGGKLLGPFVRMFGGLVTRGLAAVERFAPRLASLLLEAVTRLPGVLEGAFSRLVSFFSDKLGKVGKLAKFTLKVLGIQAAIDAVAGFSTKAYNWIAGKVGAAFREIEKIGLKAARVAIEPFSHLPFGAGEWAQKLKVQIDRELDKLNGKKPAEKLINTLKVTVDSKTGALKESTRGSGAAVGTSMLDGMIAGIVARSPDFSSATRAAVRGAIRAAKDEAKIKSPSRVFAEIGQMMMVGGELGITQYADKMVQASRRATGAAVRAAQAEVNRLQALLDKDQRAAEDRQNQSDLAAATKAVAAAKKKGKGLAEAEQQLAQARQQIRQTDLQRQLETAQKSLDAATTADEKQKTRDENAKQRRLAAQQREHAASLKLQEKYLNRLSSLRDKAGAAFDALAGRIQSAFDAKNAGWVSDAQKQINDIMRGQQQSDLQQAVTDAQQALADAQASGDQAQVLSAQRQLQRAQTDLLVNGQGGLQDQANEQQKAHEQQVAAQQDQLDTMLGKLRAGFTGQGVEYDKGMQGILDIINGYDDGFAGAGTTLGQAFANSLQAAIAAALEASGKVKDAKDAGAIGAAAASTRGIRAPGKGHAPLLAAGGHIEKSGFAYVHRGEDVRPASVSSLQSGGGVTIAPQITVNGFVGNDQELAGRVGKAIAVNLRGNRSPELISAIKNL